MGEFNGWYIPDWLRITEMKETNVLPAEYLNRQTAELQERLLLAKKEGKR